MVVFLKELLVLLVSLVSGALIFFGLIPSAVVAPDLPPPTPIVVVDSPRESTEEPVAEEPEASNDVVDIPSPTPAPPPSLIQNYEQSLEEALDALARIQTPVQQTSSVSLNDVTRAALVNILCTTAGAGPLNPISGSGVVIDPRGVVLTNAHVAQYFLLKNYPREGFVECVLRTGSPATPAFEADLLFLPPSWIAQNAQKIDDERPTGNGEHDYALLRITGALGAESVPTTLPHLPLALDEPIQNASVLLAGYPAGFLGGATIAKELYAASANAQIGTIYTFDTSTIDVFSIGGSVVAQQGSSGGAVSELNAQSPNGAALVGLIVTSSDAPDTASRDLRALSTEYIIRDFASEYGAPLATFLGRDLVFEQALFLQTIAPALTSALTNALEE